MFELSTTETYLLRLSYTHSQNLFHKYQVDHAAAKSFTTVRPILRSFEHYNYDAVNELETKGKAGSQHKR